MTASPFLRHRNAILAAALGVITLALLTAATISVVERLSASLAPACHRLLPELPRLRRPIPWRISGCLGRPSTR